jgi:hypothetical protein
MGISTWLILSGQDLVLEFPGLKLRPTAQLGPGLDRGYPTDVAVSLQQRLMRIEETTNNVAKKKMAGYLRLVTLIRRQTLRLASPGPESQ